jgi:hypothetical protein
MSRDLVIARTRALMEKDAGFMRNAGHAIHSAAIRARGAASMAGTRAKIGIGNLRADRAMKKVDKAMKPVVKSYDKSLAAAGAVVKPKPKAPVAAAGATKKGLGLGKKVLIGAGLLGAGSALGGAFSAGKVRAAQPMAPPSEYPPGY